MFGPLKKGPPNPVAIIAGCAIALAGLVAPVVVMLRAHRRNYRLATSPDGILVRVPGSKTVIPWTEVMHVRRGELYSGRTSRFSVTIQRRGGKPISVTRILRCDEDVAEFISLCDKARQRYREQPGDAEVKAK